MFSLCQYISFGGACQEAEGEKNYSGQNVERGEYDWGDRLQDADDSKMEGMVRMEGQTEGGKMRTGGYFTFRIISSRPGTKGWIKKATPPRPVIHAVASLTRDAIDKAVDGAIREDLGL
jgi:hypothetical protein